MRLRSRGAGVPRDQGQLMGWVQLPELSARSSTFGSGSRSGSSSVSQPTCEVLQRVLRGPAEGSGSTTACRGRWGGSRAAGEAAAGILPPTPGGAELGKCTEPSQSKFKCMNLPYLTPLWNPNRLNYILSP